MPCQIGAFFPTRDMPAALVAKRAAQVDIVSGGRLRLGIGGGVGAVEQQIKAMQQFHHTVR